MYLRSGLETPPVPGKAHYRWGLEESWGTLLMVQFLNSEIPSLCTCEVRSVRKFKVSRESSGEWFLSKYRITIRFGSVPLSSHSSAYTSSMSLKSSSESSASSSRTHCGVRGGWQYLSNLKLTTWQHSKCGTVRTISPTSNYLKYRQFVPKLRLGVWISDATVWTGWSLGLT